MSITKELTDLYVENAEKELKISLLRRTSVIESEKLIEKLVAQLKKEVNAASPKSLEIEKYVRAIKALRDGTEDVIKTIPNLSEQHKKLITIIKSKDPDALKSIKAKLEQRLKLRGELS